MVRPAVACLLLSLVSGAAVQVQPRRARSSPPRCASACRWKGPRSSSKGGADQARRVPRLFVSPPLDPAQGYTYTVVARWMPNDYSTITRTRVVPVKAGATVDADLRQADEHQPDEIFIRYVPTPQPVVEAMLKLAVVGPKDVVYDLGCGDGCKVVSAVTNFQGPPRRGRGPRCRTHQGEQSQRPGRRCRGPGRVPRGMFSA